jgi:hypothetical protein
MSPNQNQNPNPAEVIARTLTGAGYSRQMVKNWVAVSRFETGDFTSALYKNHHNLWGMKKSLRRENTQDYSVPPRGFAGYSSLERSANDIVLYMREFNYPFHFDSVETQVEFMKSKGYFEEPLEFYLNGVKSKMA